MQNIITSKKQEWIYIPNYLGLEAIFNTKRGVLWQVITTSTNEQLTDWYNNTHEQLKLNNIPCVNTHKKYPILIYPILFYKDITLEKTIKVGNKACDYYANIWLNKNTN